MDDLLDRYVNYLRYERNASPHTVRNYHSDLLQFRDYLKHGNPEAKVDVTAVDALAIRGFLAHLFEHEKKKSSIGRKLAAVRAFYKFLAKKGVLSANPVIRVISSGVLGLSTIVPLDKTLTSMDTGGS